MAGVGVGGIWPIPRSAVLCAKQLSLASSSKSPFPLPSSTLPRNSPGGRQGQAEGPLPLAQLQFLGRGLAWGGGCLMGRGLLGHRPAPWLRSSSLAGLPAAA